MSHFVKSNKNVNLRVAADHHIQINIWTIFYNYLFHPHFDRITIDFYIKPLRQTCLAYNTYEFA